MRLIIRAGSVTMLEQSVGGEAGEISVRFFVPLLLRWLPVSVDVRITVDRRGTETAVILK